MFHSEVGRECGSHGRDRKVCRVLVEKPERKRPPERPRYRWEDGIRMGLRETGWGVQSGSSWLRIGANGGTL
jgi:hypothetical protein